MKIIKNIDFQVKINKNMWIKYWIIECLNFSICLSLLNMLNLFHWYSSKVSAVILSIAIHLLIVKLFLVIQNGYFYNNHFFKITNLTNLVNIINYFQTYNEITLKKWIKKITQRKFQILHQIYNLSIINLSMLCFSQIVFDNSVYNIIIVVLINYLLNAINIWLLNLFIQKVIELFPRCCLPHLDLINGQFIQLALIKIQPKDLEKTYILYEYLLTNILKQHPQITIKELKNFFYKDLRFNHYQVVKNEMKIKKLHKKYLKFKHIYKMIK